MANVIEAKKLKGFRDFLPREMTVKNRVLSCIQEAARSFGFSSMDTPSVEYAETLLGSGSEDTDKEVYRFKDHGERDIALRFDLTMPFARFVSENFADLNFPFKRLQTGEVWRGEKPQKGRYRQFCQADVDIIGTNDWLADVEVVSCLTHALDKILPPGVTFTLHCNHREILNALMQKYLGQLDLSAFANAMVAIDKLEKIGQEKTVGLLVAASGCTQEQCTQLIQVLCKNSPNLRSKISDLKSECPSPHIDKVERILSALALSVPKRCNINFSTHTVRGLGYYTGLVFETTLDGLQGFGSVMSGGRYDNLVSRFGKHDLGGVGGSIGVDRLCAAIGELGAIESENLIDVFIAIADDSAIEYALDVAQKLRNANFCIEVSCKLGKLGQQLKHADKLGCKHVIVVGGNEVASSTFTLKHMQTGEELRGIGFEQLCHRLNSK